MRSEKVPESCSRKVLPGIVLVAFPALSLIGTLVFKPPVLLLWNASSSAPIGLYAVDPMTGLKKGDMVVARAPLRFRLLAGRRGYVPLAVPLVKRIAGSSGDRVCASETALSINGRVAAYRIASDWRGRRLPWRVGCRRLGRDERLILGEGARSFDGRYFGPIPSRAILGRAVPLWLR